MAELIGEHGRPLRGLRRELIWLMAAKLLGLAILWALFFSAPQRPSVDAALAGQQLSLPLS